MDRKQRAAEYLRNWKGQNYVFGLNCFNRLGEIAASFGRRASLVVDGADEDWAKPIHKEAEDSLRAAGVELAGDLIPGARPNAPREDVFRIAKALGEQNPDTVVSIGGGSGIDAAKAATAYLALGDKYPGIDVYFGMGQITQMLQTEGRKLLPHVASQIAAASGAHLTKYSNITDLAMAQKLLIIDEAVVPQRALFDYKWTATMPKDFTMDGGLDGVSHCLEVFVGLSGEALEKARPICLLGIELIVNNLKKALENPQDLEVREALGMATDLGGYAIMIGGTSGAHLTSFSLVDILSHGRACALMNPYYMVFFAPAIEDKLREVGAIYKDAGYITADLKSLTGKDLGIAVAEGMLNLSRDIGFPTKLEDVEAFTERHIYRCLTAAKNPKLDSKLKNMPVPLSAEIVDKYMGSVLEAAKVGDFRLIKSME